MTMPFLFEFHDSEVRAVEASGDVLHVLFSAASVRRSASAGHVQALAMVLAGAAWSGRVEDCVGRLSGGRLSVDGLSAGQLPLPYDAAGDVHVELTFSNGAVLSAHAGAVALRFEGEPRFRESYAC